MNPVLDFSPRLAVLPIVYGSGDFALEVRRRLSQREYECLAVALPPSFADAVEKGIGQLPRAGLVVQAEAAIEPAYNFVPIDPCQGTIAGLREAVEAGIDRAYVDLETAHYEPHGLSLPDPYALKTVALERFLATLLPVLQAPSAESQRQARICRMAYELHRLELEYDRVVFICSVADWPWIRQAYHDRSAYSNHDRSAGMPANHRVAEDHLYFALGELPYVTFLYEHRRAELMADASLAVDGVKSLLVEARDHLMSTQNRGREVTPQTLSLLLKYVRNLSLMDRRLTPDLYHLALAAKQVVGDDYALAVIEAARDYPPQRMPSAQEDPEVGLGIGQMTDAEGAARPSKNRLEGVPLLWRSLPLRPPPPPRDRDQWRMQWDPFGQCSYPPEDRRVESFQQHVREQARMLIGQDLARTEKFTTSLKDGLDIRETLRNWHTGDLYVREMPPARGDIEVVVFLFDTPADASHYTWQSTWFAEHGEESTLCFFATPFAANMVGPGIGQSKYGGCFFLFPPRPIVDVWQDPRLTFAESLEEKLVAGAALNSREKRVAVVAPWPPLTSWRQAARRFGKQLVFLPLKRFSQQTVDRLRYFHVLNSKEVRSYAARFVRDFR